MDIDSVLTVVIIAVAMGFSVMKSYKKEKQASKPKGKQEPVFTIMQEDSEEIPEIIPEKSESTVKKVGKNQEKALPSLKNQPEKSRDISLRTPEDARRAFIYSEIFNRKYN